MADHLELEDLRDYCAFRAREEGLHIDPEKIDAAVKNERDRIVVALRRLADRIESAPVDRVSEGLAWVAAAVETLVRTVERAIGREK